MTLTHERKSFTYLQKFRAFQLSTNCLESSDHGKGAVSVTMVFRCVLNRKSNHIVGKIHKKVMNMKQFYCTIRNSSKIPRRLILYKAF